MDTQDHVNDSLLLLRSLHTLVEPHHVPYVRGFTLQAEEAFSLMGVPPCVETALGCLQALVSACPDMPQVDAYRAALEGAGEPSDANPEDVLALFEGIELLADLRSATGPPAEA